MLFEALGLLFLIISTSILLEQTNAAHRNSKVRRIGTTEESNFKTHLSSHDTPLPNILQISLVCSKVKGMENCQNTDIFIQRTFRKEKP